MVKNSKLNGVKVLHVLDRSIPDLIGYSIRSKYIVEFQSKMGLTPIVMTTPKYDREIPFERINDIEYYRSYVKPESFEKTLHRLPFLREQVMMRRTEKMIERLANDNKVSIIHAHSPSLCGLPALKVARRLSIPIVYEVRAFWEDAAVDRKRFMENSLKYRISTKMEQKLFDQADTVVCICEGLRQEIARRSPKQKIRVVQNGVDTNYFIPRDKSQILIEKYKTQGKTVVGFIGSFFTFEGLADLIKSMPLVKKKINDVALLIVGTGVEDQNLRTLAAETGVAGDTVIFTGRVSHEEVQDYYSIMDILVYPRISKRITELVTPLKPLEAMAMEKTVVVSDVGGLKELVIDSQNGLTFKAGDVNDLAEKLIDLALHPERRTAIGKQARKDMIEKRDWSVISQEYRAIYGGLLS
jgi:glycogen synthase